MKGLIIRKGINDDLPSVLELIKELAIFEKEPEQVHNTVKQLENDAFGEDPIFNFFVAVDDNSVVGAAIYFTMYSTWKGKCIYLDDLIVTERSRRDGVGAKLFKAVIHETHKVNAKQLHWQVLDWNEPAIEFYKKYNASFDNEWINCKLNKEQINSIVNS